MEPPGALSAGERIAGDVPASDKLMLVLSDEDTFFNRSDLMDGTQEALHHTWYLGSII